MGKSWSKERRIRQAQTIAARNAKKTRAPTKSATPTRARRSRKTANGNGLPELNGLPASQTWPKREDAPPSATPGLRIIPREQIALDVIRAAASMDTDTQRSFVRLVDRLLQPA